MGYFFTNHICPPKCPSVFLKKVYSQIHVLSRHITILGVVIPPNAFCQAMGHIWNHFISWHHIWALCRPCGFHSNKITSQYKKHVEDYRKKKRESELNKRQELNSEFLGMLALLLFYFKRLVQILLMVLGANCVHFLVIFQDPRSSYSKLRFYKCLHSRVCVYLCVSLYTHTHTHTEDLWSFIKKPISPF